MSNVIGKDSKISRHSHQHGFTSCHDALVPVQKYLIYGTELLNEAIVL